MKSSIYEEKIINLIKSKIKLETKNINTQESEKIISDFNKSKSFKSDAEKLILDQRVEINQKKLVKVTNSCIKHYESQI